MPATEPLTVLGVRTAPQQIRYAIVSLTDGAYALVNHFSENSIQRPAGMEEDDVKYVRWVKDEVGRILRQNPEITRVALKTPEFRAGNENQASRLGNYLDAAVIIAASESGLPISKKLYSQMATTRAKVKEHAEHRVGRSHVNWSEQMADAVAIAWIAAR
jgi:hypothetical protein